MRKTTTVQPDPERVKRGRRSKRKGNRNELRTMRYFEKLGYACTRAAASLGMFDVIAVGPKDVVLAQVKSNRWPGTEETNAIRAFRCHPMCRKLILRWNDFARGPEIMEA